MQFLLYMNPQTPGPDADARVMDFAIEQALWADRIGFKGVCLTEHHFIDYNTYGNAFMMGAYLAARLSQAHIVLTIAVPALHNPMWLAQQANLLDQLARGRVLIGVGPGASPVEFVGHGRNPDQRRDLMEQVLDITLAAWRHRPEDPPLHYETPHDHGVLAHRIMPRAYAGDHPRLARATLSDDGFDWAAERGWPVMTGRFLPDELAPKLARYQQSLAEAGHDAATIAHAARWSLVQKLIYVAETDDQAVADLEGPLALYARIFRQAFPPQGPVGMSGEHGRQPINVGAAATDKAEFMNRAMIVGSPETVTRKLKAYEEAGIGSFAAFLYFGDNHPDKVRRSADLFVDRVMPRFH